MVSQLSIRDLAGPLEAVARSLPEWARGDLDEAVALTLDLSARNIHARSYVAWVWGAADDDGTPVWVLPVTVEDAEHYAPRGPVQVLMRCLEAVGEAGAPPGDVELFDWEGFVAVRAPGADPQLAPIALAEAHPAPARAEYAVLPGVAVDGPALELHPPSAPVADGLSATAAQVYSHPLRIAPALMELGWGLAEPAYPAEVVAMLRHRGHEGTPPPQDAPSLAIEDDPCRRRRYARRLLRRLLHKRKVGPGYHTAFDHLAHGVAPQDRADAYGTGEALLRAGLLGEKPSVGQRHVYLRREALPAIHALIERGETQDEALRAHWTADDPSCR